MRLRIVIDAEVEKVEGLFVSKDAIVEALADDQLSDPGSIDIEDSVYEVTSWYVELEGKV